MNIRELRKLLGWTQKQFAEYFNIPKRTIESWESGTRNPPEYVYELIVYKLQKEHLISLEIQISDKIFQKGVVTNGKKKRNYPNYK